MLRLLEQSIDALTAVARPALRVPQPENLVYLLRFRAQFEMPELADEDGEPPDISWKELATLSQLLSAAADEIERLRAAAVPASPPDIPIGWHRSQHRRHQSWNLTQCWQNENGCEIFQGRPFKDSARFVYRLARPDGTWTDYRLLSDAKSAAYPPVPASPPTEK